MRKQTRGRITKRSEIYFWIEMKKIYLVFAISGLVGGFLLFLNFTSAQGGSSTGTQPIIEDLAEPDYRQALSIKESKGRNICREAGNCPERISNASTEVNIKAAKLLEVSTTSIKVYIFGYTYTIDVEKAKIIRRFRSNSDLAEFSPGDIINVFGYLDKDNNYLVHAEIVRNMSVQRKDAAFKGTIESITPPDTFVMKTKERGSQTVIVSANTKIIIAGEEVVCITAPCPPLPPRTGSFSDLKVGQKVRVRGIWDRTLSRIQAKLVIVGDELVKNLNLGVNNTSTEVRSDNPSRVVNSTSAEGRFDDPSRLIKRIPE